MDFTIKFRHDRLWGAYEREERPDPNEHTMHVHPHMEFYYFIEGEAEYHVESSVYPLQPNDILIVRPSEAHVTRFNPDKPYERINLFFTPELLQETGNGRLLDPFLGHPSGQQNHYAARELSTDAVRICLGKLFDEDRSLNEMRSLSYFLPVLQEIHDIWRKREPIYTDEISGEPLAAQILSYINAHLSTLKNLEELEDHFFLHRCQINRIVRKHIGSSVWQYVQAKRLFAARGQLQLGILPCRAAEECGYQDYSTFFRAYKKRFGHSPQEDFRPADS